VHEQYPDPVVPDSRRVCGKHYNEIGEAMKAIDIEIRSGGSQFSKHDLALFTKRDDNSQDRGGRSGVGHVPMGPEDEGGNQTLDDDDEIDSVTMLAATYQGETLIEIVLEADGSKPSVSAARVRSNGNRALLETLCNSVSTTQGKTSPTIAQ